MRIPKSGIGFFDSGIGGLTVLTECANLLQGETLYYYGDNAHAPYGNLETKLIRTRVEKAFRRFQSLQAKAVVIACNTVTALLADELRLRYSFPIIGAEPAVLPAAKVSGEIFVLTTRATFQSPRLQNLIERAKQEYPTANFRLTPCERLAGEIECHVGERGYDYTPYLPQGNPTAVVLGCTHYLYIKEYIKAHYGCEVFDGNAGIARRLFAVLNEKSAADRDGRPQMSPTSKKGSKKLKNGNKNQVDILKNTVYCIGSGKKINRKILTSGYEQMFVL